MLDIIITAIFMPKHAIYLLNFLMNSLIYLFKKRLTTYDTIIIIIIMIHKQINKEVIMQLTCLKCGHKWESRIKHPQCCPRCKSYTWDKPKKEKEEK